MEGSRGGRNGHGQGCHWRPGWCRFSVGWGSPWLTESERREGGAETALAEVRKSWRGRERRKRGQVDVLTVYRASSSRGREGEGGLGTRAGQEREREEATQTRRVMAEREDVGSGEQAGLSWG